MIEEFERKHYVNAIEAAKILKVRPHDFVNNSKTLGLQKISEEPNRFSKEDLEFWKFVFDLRKNGLNSKGIVNEITIRNTKIRENKKLITSLKYIKSWLIELKSE